MTSLTEAYDGTAPGVTSRRLYAGTALVFLGALLAVVAVLVATTDLFGGYAVNLWGEMAARFATVRAAGILAGYIVPAAGPRITPRWRTGEYRRCRRTR